MTGLVVVFETADLASFALAKALLDADEVAYIAEGEAIQNMFGLGQYPAGYNAMIGPMRLRVASEQADRARETLAEIDD